MNGETSTQEQAKTTGRIEPTAADVRDIAQAVVDKEGQHTHQQFGPAGESPQAMPNDERLVALEKSHANLIAKLARHFPALF